MSYSEQAQLARVETELDHLARLQEKNRHFLRKEGGLGRRINHEHLTISGQRQSYFGGRDKEGGKGVGGESRSGALVNS